VLAWQGLRRLRRRRRQPAGVLAGCVGSFAELVHSMPSPPARPRSRVGFTVEETPGCAPSPPGSSLLDPGLLLWNSAAEEWQQLKPRMIYLGTWRVAGTTFAIGKAAAFLFHDATGVSFEVPIPVELLGQLEPGQQLVHVWSDCIPHGHRIALALAVSAAQN